MVATGTTQELTAEARFGAASVREFRERGWWQDGSALAPPIAIRAGSTPRASAFANSRRNPV